MSSRTPEQTMPALHQDSWWRPLVDIPITEPRWVRMVEIRPSNIPGRKILHHSIAYQVLNPGNVDAVNTGTGRGFGGVAANPSVDDRVNRRPQLMEWAIGKGYDRFMDGTGKLIMPGEKISWDNHIHAAGSYDVLHQSFYKHSGVPHLLHPVRIACVQIGLV